MLAGKWQRHRDDRGRGQGQGTHAGVTQEVSTGITLGECTQSTQEQCMSALHINKTGDWSEVMCAFEASLMSVQMSCRCV